MLPGLRIPLQRVLDTSGVPPHARVRVWGGAHPMGLHTYEYAATAAYSSNVWVSPLVRRRTRLRAAGRHTSNGTRPGRVQGRGVGKLTQKWGGPASNKAGPLRNRSRLARLRTKQGPCIGNQQCPPPLHVHVMVVFQRLVTSWLMPGFAASPTGCES